MTQNEKELMVMELEDQIEIWKKKRDELDDLIDDAYKRLDNIKEGRDSCFGLVSV